MIDLSSSSEWNSSCLERTFLRSKIKQHRDRLERVGFVEGQAIRHIIEVLSRIQRDPAFHQAPRDYLKNWAYCHPDETLAIQNISEAIQESGEAISQCRL